jgi:hypothetical protein
MIQRKDLLRLLPACLTAALCGACNLTTAVPTTILFPTPNLTMSKLFEIPTAGFGTPAPGGTESLKPTATISPTAPDCTNRAQFVSETIPDLTSFLPGAAFLKTWTLKNVGTCTWGRGYALVFDHGDRMGAPDSIPFTASVPPGAVNTFAVNLTAPSSGGDFQGFWMLQTPQGVKFGIEPDGTKAFWVKIAVSASPGCTPAERRPEENGTLFEAVFTDSPPILGAGLDAWMDSKTYSFSKIVKGTTENSARFDVSWDYDYLYLAVRVVDDTFVQETSGGANLYLGDSLEILLDADLKGDFCNAAMNGDDYQLGISPGYLPAPSLQSPSAYLWYPAGEKGPRTINVFALLTSAPDATGWFLEAKIPWSLFGISPVEGRTFGFALSVSDNDQYSTTKQQGMISTAPNRITPTNPTNWGTLQIVAKPVG